MFCEECGTKNKQNATFCEKCGHLLKEKEPEKVVKPRQPMDKNQKITIGAVVAVIVALVAGYMYISSTLKPDKVALKYFKAYASNDASALYSTLNLKDSDFVSKKLLKESLQNNDKIDLSNYSVDDVEKGKLTTKVTVKYVESGSSRERTKVINLSKAKKKKWLIFDNWAVDSSDLVVYDYSLSVPKDASLKIGGVKVKDKYKTDYSSSYTDVYKIPSILKGKYNVDVTYDSGMTLSGKLKVSSAYGSITSSDLSIAKKDKKEMTADMKKKLNAIYEAAIDKKDFDSISDLFPEDARDNMKSKYESIESYAHLSYNTLKEFSVKDIEISSLYIYSDYISVNFKVKYDYKVEYDSYGSGTKEYTGKDKEYTVYAKYKMNDGKLEFSEFVSLISYFSHY